MLTIEQYISIWCGIMVLVGLIYMCIERRRYREELRRLKDRLDMAEANRDLYEADARRYYNAWKKEKELGAVQREQAPKNNRTMFIIPEKFM